MEEKKNGRLVVRNPKVAWEIIQELILDDESLTTEELDNELKACGINPEESLKRLFELAQSVSRESHSGGSVSPHVSDVLSKLADKYYQLEEGNTNMSERTRLRQRKSSSAKANQLRSTIGRTAVKTFHRNFKEESANDQTIREKNEKLLLEKAEKLKSKKVTRKK